jgi:hypothetical protein
MRRGAAAAAVVEISDGELTRSASLGGDDRTHALLVL